MKRTLITIVLVTVVAVLATLSVTAKSTNVPTKQQQIARGEYLVTVGGCNDCHTPLKMGPKGPQPDMPRMLSGHPENFAMPPAPKGNGAWMWSGAATNTAFAGPWGVSFARNLTPDDHTGIGIWSEKKFVEKKRTRGHHEGAGGGPAPR